MEFRACYRIDGGPALWTPLTVSEGASRKDIYDFAINIIAAQARVPVESVTISTVLDEKGLPIVTRAKNESDHWIATRIARSVYNHNFRNYGRGAITIWGNVRYFSRGFGLILSRFRPLTASRCYELQKLGYFMPISGMKTTEILDGIKKHRVYNYLLLSVALPMTLIGHIFISHKIGAAPFSSFRFWAILAAIGLIFFGNSLAENRGRKELMKRVKSNPQKVRTKTPEADY